MISAEDRCQGRTDPRRGGLHPSAARSQEETVALDHPLVSIVDDDESVRESLPDLVREFGFAAQAFSSAEEFLSSSCADESICLIVDIAMPGMSGPELQLELGRRGRSTPIIFITGRGDETICARVLERGAAGLLLKPFSDSALLAAIETALHAT